MPPKKGQVFLKAPMKGPYGVHIEKKAPAQGLCPVRVAILPMILPGLNPTKLKERLARIS